MTAYVRSFYTSGTPDERELVSTVYLLVTGHTEGRTLKVFRSTHRRGEQGEAHTKAIKLRNAWNAGGLRREREIRRTGE